MDVMLLDRHITQSADDFAEFYVLCAMEGAVMAQQAKPDSRRGKDFVFHSEHDHADYFTGVEIGGKHLANQTSAAASPASETPLDILSSRECGDIILESSI